MDNSKSNGRRKFIKTTAAGTAALSFGLAGIGSMLAAFNEKPVTSTLTGPAFSTGFDQKPLPYKYDALENIIDAMTMEIHYSKHAATYSKNLKEAATAEGVASNRTVESV